MPVAREISAREIGALAPITPHTVRRFSSRTVAEVAGAKGLAVGVFTAPGRGRPRGGRSMLPSRDLRDDTDGGPGGGPGGGPVRALSRDRPAPRPGCPPGCP